MLDNVEIPSIQMVNPDDIESISVLKDAGFYLRVKGRIWCYFDYHKKGAPTERVQVTYSANMAFQNPSKKFEMGAVDALEYTVEEPSALEQLLLRGFLVD